MDLETIEAAKREPRWYSNLEPWADFHPRGLGSPALAVFVGWWFQSWGSAFGLAGLVLEIFGNCTLTWKLVSRAAMDIRQLGWAYQMYRPLSWVGVPVALARRLGNPPHRPQRPPRSSWDQPDQQRATEKAYPAGHGALAQPAPCGYDATQ